MGAIQHSSHLKKNHPPEKQNLKILAIGDGCVGKTCALVSFTSGEFPHDMANTYMPTIFENYSSLLCVNGTVFKLDLWDTAGQEDYDSTRRLTYDRTDIFMIMFSIDDRVSLSNIEHKWVIDITNHAPDSLYVLIGTKIDLRNNTEKKKVNYNRRRKTNGIKRGSRRLL